MNEKKRNIEKIMVGQSWWYPQTRGKNQKTVDKVMDECDESKYHLKKD